MHRIIQRLRAYLSQPQNANRVGLMIAAFIGGLVAVGYSRLLKLVEHVSVGAFAAHPYWMIAQTLACFVAGWWLVHRFAPRASGSGIPQVMVAMALQEDPARREFVSAFLSLRIAAVKIVSSLLCVLGGGVVGREGPTLQVTGSIFYVMGRRVRRLSSVVALDSWILAGASAGMAAAFNTPLGGIVYAIEELASKHFTRVRTAVLTAVLIAGLVSQWLVGSYLYLGYAPVGDVRFSVIPVSIAIGVMGGLLGGFFGTAVFSLQQAIGRRLHLFKLKTGLVVALACGLIVVGLALVDAHALGPGNRLISEILAGRTQAGIETVAVRFVSTVASYLSGCAGGIFAPSLALGASLGAWVSSWWHASTTVLLALLGMIAVLTGVTRCPFTSFVLIVEMTDRHRAIFPMMLTALVADGVARLTGHESFYEQSKRVMLQEESSGAPMTSRAPEPNPDGV